MRFPVVLLLLLLILTVPSGPARAEAPDATAAPLDRGAWAREVRLMRSAERAELAELSRKARIAAPGAEHAQAQRALEAGKLVWRRRVLEAQLVRTRAAGLAETSRKLELRLAELDAVAQRRLPATPAGEER